MHGGNARGHVNEREKGANGIECWRLFIHFHESHFLNVTASDDESYSREALFDS